MPSRLSPEQCVELEAGLCGRHVDRFDKIFRKSLPDAKLRSVEFYVHDEKDDKNFNHVVIEVFLQRGLATVRTWGIAGTYSRRVIRSITFIGPTPTSWRQSHRGTRSDAGQVLPQRLNATGRLSVDVLPHWSQDPRPNGADSRLNRARPVRHRLLTATAQNGFKPVARERPEPALFLPTEGAASQHVARRIRRADLTM